MLTEPQADRLYDRAFTAWLQEALQNPPEGVRRALRRTSAPSFGGGDATVRSIGCATPGATLAEWRDFPRPGGGRRSIAPPRSIAWSARCTSSPT